MLGRLVESGPGQNQDEVITMFLVYPGGGWFGIIILILTAAISWFFLRKVLFRSWTGQVPLLTNNEDHLQVLKRRYANGEISRDDYLRMKDELKD